MSITGSCEVASNRRRRCSSRLLTALAAFTLGVCGCFSPEAPAPAPSPSADTDGIPSLQQRLKGGPDSGPTADGTLFFAERTANSGIDFVPRNGQESGHLAIVETLGVGVALIDCDLDGRLDVFAPGGGEFVDGPALRGRPAGLFRQSDDWKFSDVGASQAGIDLTSLYAHGAIAGDYNNDGIEDLLVTGYGGVRLFANMGDGTFEECSASAHLVDPSWSTGAAWGDVNRDGAPDLFVVHYLDWSFQNNPECLDPLGRTHDVCAPAYFDGLVDALWLSNGDGTFRDASAECGITEPGKGLAVLMADLDLDGDLDIYVANDTTPNLLYRNNGEGRFEEIGLASGAALSETAKPDGSMGVDLLDYNRDGLPDLWVANFENQSFALYRNLGDCQFQHASKAWGITAVGDVYVGFGTVAFDADRDGADDLFAATGHIRLAAGIEKQRQLPLLFRNTGKTFVNVASTAGDYFTSKHIGRGAAAGDIDRDGDLDLAIAHTNEPISILSNESRAAGGWLEVRLVGTASPRDPVGARLVLTTDAGLQTRQLCGGASYLSSSEHRLHFGLGAARELRSLEIHWPSGRVQTLSDLAPNRRITVVESAGNQPALFAE